MKRKKAEVIHLDVDYIGGEELTPKQKQIIKDYFNNQEKGKQNKKKKSKNSND